jgi:hypothetical protein
MSDTETLLDNAKNSDKYTGEKSDFPSMGIDLLKRVNIKVAFFLMLIGLFLFSDVFIEKVLPASYQDGANCPNSMGTMMQLLLLVLAYLVIDLLNQGGVI